MNLPTLHPANNETQCNCYITLREMFKLLSCETEFSEMCQNLIPLLILVLQYPRVRGKNISVSLCFVLRVKLTSFILAARVYLHYNIYKNRMK